VTPKRGRNDYELQHKKRRWFTVKVEKGIIREVIGMALTRDGADAALEVLRKNRKEGPDIYFAVYYSANGKTPDVHG
jgi:hypothetical protein